jgi:hypothetical protein
MFRVKQGCSPPKDPEKYDDILRIYKVFSQCACMHGTIKGKKSTFVLLLYDLLHPCSPCWQVKANMYQLYEEERMKGGAILAVSAVVARGAGPK